ncbi:hypothetical protein AB0M80_21290 [Amycolatopsis sp. NPDC051045]|uniref:hypothetical protein n=1 Tax=Amycolatopsis sp. NPDC051045 TaxID=3156922 RepID=UPI003420BE61
MSDAYSPIHELNLLKQFEDEVPAFNLEGFELREYNDKKAIDSWLDSDGPNKQEFLDRLIPFARASWSGSVYALWRCDDRADLAGLPVVLLGDEGGLSVAARDLRELFQLLAVIDEEDADEEDLDDRQAYVDWLDQNFGLAPPDDDGEVIFQAARAEYGQRFAEWTQRVESRHR